MKWFKVQIVYAGGYRAAAGEYGFKYYYAKNAADARERVDASLSGAPLAIGEVVEIDGSEINPVRRGLTEASTEQIKAELKRRGWGVRLT